MLHQPPTQPAPELQLLPPPAAAAVAGCCSAVIAWAVRLRNVMSPVAWHQLLRATQSLLAVRFIDTAGATANARRRCNGRHQPVC